MIKIEKKFLDKFYIKVELTGLKYTPMKGDKGEKQINLFFLGWYEREDKKSKLFSIIILFLGLQIGLIQ